MAMPAQKIRTMVYSAKHGEMNGTKYASLQGSFPQELGDDDIGMTGIQVMSVKCPPKVSQFLVEKNCLPCICDITTRFKMSGTPPKATLEVTDLIPYMKTNAPIRNFLLNLEVNGTGDLVFDSQVDNLVVGDGSIMGGQVVTEAGVVDTSTGEVVDSDTTTSSSGSSSRWKL